MSLVSIYFLIYECFITNKSIAKTTAEHQEFIKHIDVESVSAKYFKIIWLTKKTNKNKNA